MRMLAERPKRRWRAGGRDPVLDGRRARAAEPTLAEDIDVVITWVNGADRRWQAMRDEVLSATAAVAPVRDAATSARFTSLEELRYALRGVDRHLPWVRQVLLVTAGEDLPDWLDQSRVRWVTHPQFMAPGARPTLNSHAIEAAMWRIDGLSEHFIYLNDDVLVTRPMRPNDFFDPTGRPRLCFTTRAVPSGPPDEVESAAVVGARNARRLLAEAGIGEANRLIAHTPFAQRRSIHADLINRFPRELEATEHSRVRSSSDVPPVFLHNWYAVLTGRAEEVQMAQRYVELSAANGPAQLAVDARRRDVDFLCTNLAADPPIAWPQLAAQVTAGLEALLPGRSRFELPD